MLDPISNTSSPHEISRDYAMETYNETTMYETCAEKPFVFAAPFPVSRPFTSALCTLEESCLEDDVISIASDVSSIASDVTSLASDVISLSDSVISADELACRCETLREREAADGTTSCACGQRVRDVARTQRVKNAASLSRRSRVIQKRKGRAGAWRRGGNDICCPPGSSSSNSPRLHRQPAPAEHPTTERKAADEVENERQGAQSPDSGIGSDGETLSRQSSMSSVGSCDVTTTTATTTTVTLTTREERLPSEPGALCWADIVKRGLPVKDTTGAHAPETCRACATKTTNTTTTTTTAADRKSEQIGQKTSGVPAEARTPKMAGKTTPCRTSSADNVPSPKVASGPRRLLSFLSPSRRSFDTSTPVDHDESTISTSSKGSGSRSLRAIVPTAADFIPRKCMSVGEQLRRRLTDTPRRRTGGGSVKRKCERKLAATSGGSTPRRRFTPSKRKVRLLSCLSSPSCKGGTYAEAGAPTSTHVVVDETNVKTLPFDTHHGQHVVKAEWFWASIQMDACADEHMYKFEEVMETPTTANAAAASRGGRSTPMSGGKSRKRKRLRENLAQLAADADIDSPMCAAAAGGADAHKRRSNELARMSLSASFLEVTDPSLKSPDSLSHVGDANTTPSSSSTAASKMSARQLTVMELLQTERNYVGILHTIIKVFKEEIERTDQPGGPLLSATDTKIIFGGFPPIYDVHVAIRDQLQQMVNHWSEDGSVGAIFLQHAEALLKAYPPFVNFFENTKETMNHCDKTKPRFHAFLKVCQSKPECGRQTLAELLIRPVQRLPSVMLLLKEIQKRTDKNAEDHVRLDEAILKLEEVMTYINEDKRKAEGHQLMFDIINDIDNCPPNLLSSHRSFIMKVDVIEVTDTLSGKGDNLSLFLFNDSMEMCKRRMRVLNAKSPAAHAPKTPQKAYKHLEMMQLSNIKKVVNITDTKECKGVFAFVTKELDKKEKLFAFMIVDEEVDKPELLTTFSKHISNTTCRADFENLMASLDASSLQLEVHDLHQKTLSKAATKFGKRVSRAFSFNKTPRKLKRAMSSMSQVMSPFRRDSLGFVNPNTTTTTTTPSNLRGLRLASSNDLSPLQDETFYSDIVEGHAMFAVPLATPKKRRETLARLPCQEVGNSMLRMRTAGSCLTLDRLHSSMAKMALDRTSSLSSRRDASSPLFAAPSTPNLTLQFNKAATLDSHHHNYHHLSLNNSLLNHTSTTANPASSASAAASTTPASTATPAGGGGKWV